MIYFCPAGTMIVVPAKARALSRAPQRRALKDTGSRLRGNELPGK